MKTVVIKRKGILTKNVFKLTVITVIGIFLFVNGFANDYFGVEQDYNSLPILTENMDNPDTVNMVNKYEIIDSEPEIELEPWMLDVEIFIAGMNTGSSQNKFNSFDEELYAVEEPEIELEPWMLDIEIFMAGMNANGSQDKLIFLEEELFAEEEPDIKLEPWMLNFLISNEESNMLAGSEDNDFLANPLLTIISNNYCSGNILRTYNCLSVSIEYWTEEINSLNKNRVELAMEK